MSRKAVSITMVIGPLGEKWEGTLVTRVLYDDGSVVEQWNGGAWHDVKAADTAEMILAAVAQASAPEDA